VRIQKELRCGIAIACLVTGSACGDAVEPDAKEVLVRHTPADRVWSRSTRDWLLRSDAIAAAVAAGPIDGVAAGRVLGVGENRPNAALRSITPLIRCGDALVEPLILEVERGRASRRNAIRVRGVARFTGAEIAVERAITAADVPGALSIHTRLETESERCAPELVERVEWGTANVLLGGVGLAASERSSGAATWIGTENGAGAIAIAFRASDLAAVKTTTDPHESAIVTDLAPIASRTNAVRTLVVVRPTLAEAVRALGFARNAPFPQAVVHLPFVPPRASLRVTDREGRMWLRTRPSAHGTIVPLPFVASDERVSAIAYGHRASPSVPLAAGDRVRLVIPDAGRLIVHVVDPATGERLPARLLFRGGDRTATPDLGPDSSANGAADTAASASGEFDLTLPTGEYVVRASHGPEWTIEEQTVVITGEQPAVLEFELERAVDTLGFVPCDFHLHSQASPDSEVSFEDRVTALAAEGIRFAVPTDHNTVTDYGPAIAALALADFGTISGVEATTHAPAFGHFNAFPFPYDPSLPDNGAPPYQGLSPAALFAGLRERAPGALVQVNHPRLEPRIGYFDQTGFDPATGVASGDYSDDYDLLEVWNGFDLARTPNAERNLREWMAMLARAAIDGGGRRVVATGNSDSHSIRREWAGYPRTYVETGGSLAPEAVMRGLRRGRAIVTNGPFVNLTLDGRGVGEWVEPRNGRARASVTLASPPWIRPETIDLYVGTEIAETIAVPRMRGRFRRDLTLAVPERGFVLAVVRSTQDLRDHFGRRGVRPLAFTNPIWLGPAPPEPPEAPIGTTADGSVSPDAGADAEVD
jgi:hypothetical protein